MSDSKVSNTLASCCRDNKAYQGGDRGWYIPLRSHSAAGGCRPLGCLAMTLATPGYGKPSLLSLNEVKELLRQFGKVNSAEVLIFYNYNFIVFFRC
jgi:hypothetical protein